MHTSALAFQTLKYAGVAYLVYIACATWKDTSAFALESTPSRSTALSLVVKALLLNILNPKLSVFFLAFLPQFIDTNAPSTALAFVFLGVVFNANGTVWNLGVAYAAARAASAMRGARTFQRWIDGAIGALFVAFGMKLALFQR